MTGWSVDVRQSVRRLVRKPVFSVVAVATLGIGAGAFGAVWASVESVLLEPMPYDRPDDLAWVWRDYREVGLDIGRGWLGSLEILTLQESEAVEAVIAMRSDRGNLVVPGGRPQDVRFTLVSAGFFDALGVRPALGRGFLQEEDVPDGPRVVVLGHPLWRQQFGSDPDVVGTTIELDGESFEVVGVAPEGFDFVKHSSLGEPVPADLWVPLRQDLAAADPGGGWLAGLVRWRADATEAEREATLARLADKMSEEVFGGQRLGIWDVPLKPDLVGGVRSPLLAILVAAGLLLLILGANLATLLLARFAERSRDTAVRAALGAGAGGLARWMTTELLALGIAGAALALVVASWGSRGLAAVAGDALPRTGEIGLDASGAAIVLGLIVALLVLAGAPPLFGALRLRPGEALRGGTRGGDAPGVVRGRTALVAAQVGLSLVLLVGTGLLARSFAGLLRTDPGFDPGATLTFRVAPDATSYPDAEDLASFRDRLLGELRALPGVEAAGATDALPLGLETNQQGVSFPGSPVIAEGNDRLADVFRISDGYVEAAGLRLLAGRGFRSDEGDEASRVAVVDDVLARQFFPDREPREVVGRPIHVMGDTATVVGVVDQARFYDVHLDDRGQVYVPARWSTSRGFHLAVRTSGDARNLAGPARSLAASLDPGVPVSEVRTLREIVSASLRPERLNLWIVATFAVGALGLVTLAVFGVVSGMVTRRRAEIGIRMAVGADAGRVVGMVLLQGLRPVAIGAAVGLVGAWFLARLLAGLLVDVSPGDPLTYAAVVVVLLVIAAVAATLPARRAATLPPSEALRTD